MDGFLVTVALFALFASTGSLKPVKHAALHRNEAVPEQIHLSWDGDGSHMTVTWSTKLPAPTKAQFQTKPFDPESEPDQATGQETRFISTDNGSVTNVQYVHRCTMTDLKPRIVYYYRVGDGRIWSEVFHFRSLQDGSDWSPRLAIYGDLGLDNAQSLKRLRRDVIKRRIDMVIHVGDFGYDLNDDNGQTGDAFLRMIQPVAAFVPYQTVVGNHEQFNNFTQYKNRFTMPGRNDGFFYQFAVGPANFVVFSTEFYFFVEYGVLQVNRQYKWLRDQLEKLNELSRRQERPWIITLGHRPMYCSNDDADDCTLHESIVRTGNKSRGWKSLEKLFYKNGVDLCIWAHEHSYERLWPVYNRAVFNGSNPLNPYDNPGAPVHVTSGSAGCKEKHDHFINPEDWSAFRNNDYGYAKMHVKNRTHIDIQQVSDEKGGAIIDAFTLIKSQSGFGRHAKKPR